MIQSDTDVLVENSQRFLYRGGHWTTEHGMRVSHAESQRMTMRFYELNGRSPRLEPVPVKRTVAARKTKSDAKAQALRAAIAKATANKRTKR
ncbi:MAG: hypothetical protein AAGN82_04905 [Myxococcota bacterium]